jgi:class 3 adenylate cyclase
MAGSLESLPLPAEPTLAAWAVALNEAGYWAYVFDTAWRFVFVTDDLRLGIGDTGEVTIVPLGFHYFSTEATRFRTAMAGGSITPLEYRRARFPLLARYMLATTPDGRDGLRRRVDPDVADLVDELQVEHPPHIWTWYNPRDFRFAGTRAPSWSTWIALSDSSGNLAGYCNLLKPAAGMSQLAVAVALADPTHLERMRLVEFPDRHPAAILMADLEASSPLARRLSTAQYFAFVRRLVRAADDRIIDEGGIVGRHSGDGVAAFFLAETTGSESAAAKSCIVAARTLRDVLAEVAQRSELPQSELSLRFGLHWGATLYMGRIATRGRSEVNALGDEMNETARIEACASRGRALASKSLIERLNQTDADMIGLDPHHLTYTPLAELATATEKARRDAPSIAVCEV